MSDAVTINTNKIEIISDINANNPNKRRRYANRRYIQ